MTSQQIADEALREDQARRAAVRAGDQSRALAHDHQIAALVEGLAATIAAR